MQSPVPAGPSPVSSLLSFAALLLLAPLVPGVATRTRALLTGRRGQPMWQLYADLAKLMRKGVVYSTTTTGMLQLTGPVLVATTVLACTLVPLDGRSALFRFSGDAVAFAYALALGRFVLVLGALDTGSSFEGMGASREVTLASLVEPGLFVTLVALSVGTRDLSLSGMLGPPLWRGGLVIAPAVALLAGSVFVLMLAECARVPVDDPNTHLELTMIHEVMVLDHAGPDLGFVLYSSALKLALFGALIVGLTLPRAALSAGASLLLLVAGVIAVAMLVGLVEATVARLRLPRVPLYIASGSALGLFGLILLLQ